MKIIVYPEKLQELSREFDSCANRIASIESSLRQAVSGLDWETRRKANIEASLLSLQNLSSKVKEESTRFSSFLSTKSHAFYDADMKYTRGLAPSDLLSADISRLAFPSIKVGNLLGVATPISAVAFSLAPLKKIFDDLLSKLKSILGPRTYLVENVGEPSLLKEEAVHEREKHEVNNTQEESVAETGKETHMPKYVHPKAASAVEYAKQELNDKATISTFPLADPKKTPVGSKLNCAKFVANAYGNIVAGKETAKLLYDELRAQGKISTAGEPPLGALVFFDFTDPKTRINYGHVGIYIGDGKAVSAGLGQITEHNYDEWPPGSPNLPYLGWSPPPDRWLK